jgi:hypothetical protein
MYYAAATDMPFTRRLVPLLVITFTLMGLRFASASCLSYEPAVVVIRGTLRRQIFPGPPDYENLKKGDKPETYWVLETEQPFCVMESPIQPDLDPGKSNVSRVQLALQPEMYGRYKGLVGKKVTASGTLFAAITAHHYTPVLLQVRSISLPTTTVKSKEK